MKKLKININSFKLGEGKQAELQSNPSLYYMSAKKLINFIPRNSNILTRRPGTKYLNLLAIDKTTPIKLLIIDFAEDTYLLEFIPNKLKIYKNNNLLLKANKAYEINTPYTNDMQINSLYYTIDNLNNSIFLFCKHINPYILTKDTYGDEFTLKEMQFSDGPYEDINKTDITLTAYNSVGSNIIVEASADIFKATDIERHLRIFDSSKKTWGWGIITKFISNTKVEINIKKAVIAKTATRFWRKGVFNKYVFPKMGVIFNSRLYLANAATGINQTKVWASCYNDFLNFAPTVNQEDFSLLGNVPDTIAYSSAITFAISEIKEILWVVAAQQYVIVGSHEGIFALMPLDFNKSLSPFNFIVQKINNNKASNLIKSNNQFIFYTNNSNNINALEYIFDSISPKEITNILPLNKNYNTDIKDIALSFFSENIITVLFNDGKIAFVNINIIDKELIYAFSEVILGGNKPIVKAMVANNKYLYLLVYRNINDKTEITLEYIDWQELNIALRDSISLENLQYLDCSKFDKTNIPRSIVSVEENDTTAIIADDFYIGEYLAENGMVELKIPAFKIVKGYNYLSYYQSFNLNDVINFSALSNYKKLNIITIGFINSYGGVLQENNKSKINNIASSQLIERNNNFFSGYKNFNITSSWCTEVNFSLSQSIPMPLNISYCGIEILNN